MAGSSGPGTGQPSRSAAPRRSRGLKRGGSAAEGMLRVLTGAQGAWGRFHRGLDPRRPRRPNPRQLPQLPPREHWRRSIRTPPRRPSFGDWSSVGQRPTQYPGSRASWLSRFRCRCSRAMPSLTLANSGPRRGPGGSPPSTRKDELAGVASAPATAPPRRHGGCGWTLVAARRAQHLVGAQLALLQPVLYAHH